MKPFSVSLIVSTYNYEKALELTLLSIMRQSILPNEVIIADDGSKHGTKKVIEKFKKKPMSLIHCWHKDNGFRKTIILNEAISRSSSEYIIQIDGDIILHKHFIKDHIKSSKKGVFIEGSRVWLNKTLTKLSQKKKQIYFNWFSNGIKNRFNAMYIPFLTPLFRFENRSIKNAINTRGCNMSFWKKDLISVNGYDEEMTGWGREDSEISVRLVNAGLTKRKIKFAGIQFHQYHPLTSRTGLNKNDEILKETISQKKEKCKKGLNRHYQCCIR